MTSLDRRVWQARSVGAALLIPPLLSVVSLSRLAPRLAPRLARPGRPREPELDTSLAWWTDRMLRALPPPWRHTCLRRAAVLFYLLRKAGRPVALRIGVSRTAGSLAAHAWLELEGKPYLEPDAGQPAQFEPIASFPEELAGAPEHA